MKDLPQAYRNQLGTDPGKWATEEQAIRQQYQGDFKVAGGTVPNVSGDPPANGAKPGAVIDMGKMSAYDKIGLGLKTAKPSLLAGADATAATAVTATQASVAGVAR